MTKARPDIISVIIPIQETSRGTPVAIIDWDNALTKSEYEYEIIATSFKESNSLSALRAGFRSSVANMKFASSETDNLHDIISTAVNIASGEIIVLASPEVFPTISDLSTIANISTSEVDIIFGYAGSHTGSIVDAVCRFFSPVGSREFKEGIISARKETILNLMPVINSFPKNTLEALAISAQKLGLSIMESSLTATVTPGMVSRSPSSKIISSIKTKAALEFAWGRRDLSIFKKVY